MTTWLANDKMSPELVQRLSASVRGETGRASRKRSHSHTFLLRLFAVASVMSICIVGIVSYRTSQQEISQLRAELTEKVKNTNPSHVGADLVIIEDWLLRAGKTAIIPHPAQDFIDPSTLSALKARPSVYIRGPLKQFKSSAGITQAAFESTTDSFVLCLMNPPAAESEKVLLESVILAYRGGDALSQRIGPIARLYDLFAAAPLTETNWLSRVEQSHSLAVLKQVEHDFLIAKAQSAVRTPELLLYLIDEDKSAEAPSEFDGASRHVVRIGLVDLKHSRELMRISRVVDPSWISEHARLRYASGLDSCRLGQEIRRSLEAPQK